MTNIRSLVLALLLSVGLAVPYARADVVFSFALTSFSGASPIVPQPSVSFTVSTDGGNFGTDQNAAFDGFGPAQTPLDLTGTGIDTFAFQANNGPVFGPSWFMSSPNNGEFFTPGWSVTLHGTPTNIQGGLSYSGEFYDFSLFIAADGTVTGTYVSDAPFSGCDVNPECTFTGTMTAAEPTSLALLAVGVVGMLALSRRPR
jgi:hypothetical protein